MSLKKTASQMEAIVLGLNQQEREAVLWAFQRMQEAAAALGTLPEPLFDLMGLAVAEMIGRKAFRATWRSMMGQVIDGAPTLLGPHQAAALAFAEQLDNPHPRQLAASK